MPSVPVAGSAPQSISSLIGVNQPTANPSGGATLGPNAFLQILTTELQHQDPTQPTDPTQSVTQLAQFSALQYQQQLATSFASFQGNFGVLQAASLIGKSATVSSADASGNTSTITGTINSISVQNGQPYFSMTDANGKPIELDGAYAVDPTHPGTKGRIDKFIDDFKRRGFEYVKLDFLTHGALESSARFDATVQTGVQAYNQGMQYVVDRIGGTMFVSESIAPLFPYSYGHSRRVACDTYGAAVGSGSAGARIHSTRAGSAAEPLRHVCGTLAPNTSASPTPSPNSSPSMSNSMSPSSTKATSHSLGSA